MRKLITCQLVLSVACGTVDAWQNPAESASFHAELREEDWMQDGRRVEVLTRITRLSDGSFLQFHQYSGLGNTEWRRRFEHFSLFDRGSMILYSGDTLTKAAYPRYLREPVEMMDTYGNCAALFDARHKKTKAGQIRGYDVILVERSENNEQYSRWIAPALGCFALRSQVLVDGWVRERVETVRLDILEGSPRLVLPKAIRIVSPQTFCDLYIKRHRGEPCLPKDVCARLQREYDSAQRSRPTERKSK